MEPHISDANKPVTVHVEFLMGDIYVLLDELYATVPNEYLTPITATTTTITVPYMAAVGMADGRGILLHDTSDIYLPEYENTESKGNVLYVTLNYLWSDYQAANVYGEKFPWIVRVVFVDALVDSGWLSPDYDPQTPLMVANWQTWAQGFDQYMEWVGIKSTAYTIRVTDIRTGTGYTVH